jgi:hypothetical protein
MNQLERYEIIQGRLDAHRKLLRRQNALINALCFATILIGFAVCGLGLYVTAVH